MLAPSTDTVSRFISASAPPLNINVPPLPSSQPPIPPLSAPPSVFSEFCNISEHVDRRNVDIIPSRTYLITSNAPVNFPKTYLPVNWWIDSHGDLIFELEPSGWKTVQTAILHEDEEDDEEEEEEEEVVSQLVEEPQALLTPDASFSQTISSVASAVTGAITSIIPPSS